VAIERTVSLAAPASRTRIWYETPGASEFSHDAAPNAKSAIATR